MSIPRYREPELDEIADPGTLEEAREQIFSLSMQLDRAHGSRLLDRESLRDRFAMAALTGLLAAGEGAQPPADLAVACFRVADAMIAARDAGKDGAK